MNKNLKFGPKAKEASSEPVSALINAGYDQALSIITESTVHPSLYWSKFEEVIEQLKSKEEAIELLKVSQTASGYVEFLRGGILLRIKQEGWFEPYDNFTKFCEYEFAFAIGKAQQLMRIYKGITEAQVPHSELHDIDWTKLRIIVQRVQPGEISQWLEKAKKLTVKKLGEEIKAKTPVEENKKMSIPFKVYPDESETIVDAIALAKEIEGDMQDHQALEGICMSYMSTANHTKFVNTHSMKDLCLRMIEDHKGNEPEAIEEIIAQVESAFPDWSISINQAKI